MERIRFAILGTANIARKIGPAIRASDTAELIGIASRSEESAHRFGDELEITRRYSDYQQALDDPEIDAVYIPLPPSLHLEWTRKAAQAGKHILCEKPLARNASEVRQMIDVCRQHGVVLLDGVMWYHTPRAAAIRKLLTDGKLGTIRQINSAFTFRWNTMPMDNLRLHRDMGGGSLLDLGWYCIGATLMLLNQMPTQVFATAQWCNDVDTRMNAFLWFPDDVMATVECGFDTVRRRWIEVAGTQETLFCDDFTRPWNAEQTNFRTVDGDGTTQMFSVPHRTQEVCMVEYFCQLVRNRDMSHSWLHLSEQTQQVCDLLDRSARTNQIIAAGNPL